MRQHALRNRNMQRRRLKVPTTRQYFLRLSIRQFANAKPRARFSESCFSNNVSSAGAARSTLSKTFNFKSFTVLCKLGEGSTPCGSMPQPRFHTLLVRLVELFFQPVHSTLKISCKLRLCLHQLLTESMTSRALTEGESVPLVRISGTFSVHREAVCRYIAKQRP